MMSATKFTIRQGICILICLASCTGGHREKNAGATDTVTESDDKPLQVDKEGLQVPAYPDGNFYKPFFNYEELQYSCTPPGAFYGTYNMVTERGAHLTYYHFDSVGQLIKKREIRGTYRNNNYTNAVTDYTLAYNDHGDLLYELKKEEFDDVTDSLVFDYEYNSGGLKTKRKTICASNHTYDFMSTIVYAYGKDARLSMKKELLDHQGRKGEVIHYFNYDKYGNVVLVHTITSYHYLFHVEDGMDEGDVYSEKQTEFTFNASGFPDTVIVKERHTIKEELKEVSRCNYITNEKGRITGINYSNYRQDLAYLLDSLGRPVEEKNYYSSRTFKYAAHKR